MNIEQFCQYVLVSPDSNNSDSELVNKRYIFFNQVITCKLQDQESFRGYLNLTKKEYQQYYKELKLDKLTTAIVKKYVINKECETIINPNTNNSLMDDLSNVIYKVLKNSETPNYKHIDLKYYLDNISK